MFLKKSIETRSITYLLCVWIIFPSRKPRSCTEKTAFLHILKRGIPKWTLNGEFLKNTEVLKIIRNPKKSRDFENNVILKSRDFEIA